MVWAKVRGTHKQSKMKKKQTNCETVPHRPQRQKGRQKVERENARLGFDRATEEWHSGPEETAPGKYYVTERNASENKNEGKKAGVFVESCHVGWFEGTSFVSFHLALNLKQHLAHLSQSRCWLYMPLSVVIQKTHKKCVSFQFVTRKSTASWDK